MSIKSFHIYKKKDLDKEYAKEALKEPTKNEVLNTQIGLLLVIIIISWMVFMPDILEYIAWHF